MSLARGAARALETGRWDGFVSRALASALAPVAARGLVRPAVVPPEIALVCVGGATLGGSGKTRVAIACARELASRGVRVALVGHAYRALPARARVVSEGDRLEDVGDEALVCARALARWAVPVVVGPTRQAAIDRAASLAPRPDVLVLDGPLAVRGRRERSLSLLAVDAGRPWGSGRLPPAGDLRAARDVLLARADHVVPVDATPDGVRWQGGRGPTGASPGAAPDAGASPIASLRGAPVGLFTAIARPDRLVRALAAAGVRPRAIVSVADHGPAGSVTARVRDAGVEAWIATAKCALHLAPVSPGVPLGILDADVPLPPALLASLGALRPRSFE
ncbi:MAG: tetraacyldisaccharide 4'-kinase [Labilithrix sp.]|nr:tetraacyldisaccharide 4'-kinase [Labilithrix sp.]